MVNTVGSLTNWIPVLTYGWADPEYPLRMFLLPRPSWPWADFWHTSKSSHGHSRCAGTTNAPVGASAPGSTFHKLYGEAAFRKARLCTQWSRQLVRKLQTPVFKLLRILYTLQILEIRNWRSTHWSWRIRNNLAGSELEGKESCQILEVDHQWDSRQIELLDTCPPQNPLLVPTKLTLVNF